MLSCSLLTSKVAYSFHLVFFRCHSVSPKWGFHKRFRCPITLPNRLAQLDILLLV